MKLVSTLLLTLWTASAASDLSYSIVDTAQEESYDAEQAIFYPNPGEAYFGQDGQYLGNAPSYRDNQDGTISDLVTDLMWTKDPGSKKTYDTAIAEAATCRVGGYSDWRLPNIKELYSLIQLNGTRPNPMSVAEGSLTPFIDTNFFNFEYGDTQKGERIIDAQFASSTLYAGKTMKGTETGFGVNFADGRLKGYSLIEPLGSEKKFFVLYVRGHSNYGINQFRNNLDGTITDAATGLTWMQTDSGQGLDWPSALKYAEKMEHAGYTDWRLPNAKELHSIIDYSRSPDATDSASIAPLFNATEIINELGTKDYGHYWTSSTYAGKRDAKQAIYFAFGRALAYIQDYFSGSGVWIDVHGAGSQLSELKVGDAAEFPQGRGPNRDAIRIQNMVRLVRGGAATLANQTPDLEESHTPPKGTADEKANPST
ncbi:Lcl C-terminal domain-containing protein [Coraliomargarita sp. W4R53]